MSGIVWIEDQGETWAYGANPIKHCWPFSSFFFFKENTCVGKMLTICEILLLGLSFLFTNYILFMIAQIEKLMVSAKGLIKVLQFFYTPCICPL